MPTMIMSILLLFKDFEDFPTGNQIYKFFNLFGLKIFVSGDEVVNAFLTTSINSSMTYSPIMSLILPSSANLSGLAGAPSKKSPKEQFS